MMTEAEWKPFLQKFSRVLLALDEKEEPEHRLFSPGAHLAGYIGYPAATEEQIVAVEQRLGKKLLSSYRNFLRVTNGWPLMHWAAMPGELWPVQRIYCIGDYDPREIMIWAEGSRFNPDWSPEEHLLKRADGSGYRKAYVQNLISISDHGDACDLLLSPEVVDKNGEWECWEFASWYAGAARFASFVEWMHAAYKRVEERLNESS